MFLNLIRTSAIKATNDLQLKRMTLPQAQSFDALVWTVYEHAEGKALECLGLSRRDADEAGGLDWNWGTVGYGMAWLGFFGGGGGISSASGSGGGLLLWAWTPWAQKRSRYSSRIFFVTGSWMLLHTAGKEDKRSYYINNNSSLSFLKTSNQHFVYKVRNCIGSRL